MANAVRKMEDAPAVPEMITPAQMIQHAIQNGSGVDVMERLLALQERHDAFQARKAFDDAMADLRKNLPKITKSRTVDFESRNGGTRTNYKFEDLAEITEALSGPMSDVGLSFRWYTDNVQGGVKVTCRITHRDGHYEETSLVGPLDASGNKNPIQAIGSAVTYLQRYTIKAAVGIAAAHDDDAQEVTHRAAAPVASSTPKPASKGPDTRSLYDRLSKANRDIETIEKFDTFWANKNTVAAFNSLPADWARELTVEKNDKAAELQERAALADSDFPGDFDLTDHLDRIAQESAA